MILEINTVNFLYKLSKKYNKNTDKLLKISEVPVEEWQKVTYDGIIKYIWLMGIWQRSKLSRKIALQNVKQYLPLLQNPQKTDFLGSAYSIVNYVPDPIIGNFKDLLKVKNLLNKLGVGLILDFIPNHLSLDNEYINEPIFVEVGFDEYIKNPDLFYVVPENTRFIAYGKDPFFPPWTDTLQINIFSKKAQKILLKQLRKISKYADGVRVDMAMLLLKDIFYNNWKEYIKEGKPEEEFWQIATNSIDMLFIAEAYWNTENKLLELGFDYTYDKKFLDSIMDFIYKHNFQQIRYCLSLNINFQRKLVRFLENHDEERIASKIDENKARCILPLFFTCPGMKMIYWEQFEGQTIKIPVQILRSIDNYKPIQLYQKLIEIYFKIQEIIEKGTFFFLKVNQIFDDSYQNILSYGYKLENKTLFIVINFLPIISQCIINLNESYPRGIFNFEKVELSLVELLKGRIYYRNPEKIHIILEPYESQIFLCNE